jgi:pimeloyl-ACP methyl ester carboxylesterase
VPLLFFMHFTGNLDHWDPALIDGFAQDREVILFNNAGISSSSGEVPTSIEEMAQHAAAFTDALGIKKLDALGFSMGGFIAQQFAIDRPDLVRKLILAGTGPRSGEGMGSLTPEAQEIFGAKYDPPDELWLRVPLPVLRKDLGLIYCRSGDLKNGYAELLEAQKLTPDDPDIAAALQVLRRTNK